MDALAIALKSAEAKTRVLQDCLKSVRTQRNDAQAAVVDLQAKILQLQQEAEARAAQDMAALATLRSQLAEARAAQKMQSAQEPRDGASRSDASEESQAYWQSELEQRAAAAAAGQRGLCQTTSIYVREPFRLPRRGDQGRHSEEAPARRDRYGR